MMPENVEPQHPDDDTVDESVADPDAPVEETEEAEQAEIDDLFAGISDDERADAERMARPADPHAADSDVGDTRSQRNP